MSWILGSLQEHSLVLGVIQVDRLVAQIKLEQELLAQACLLIVPLCNKDESVLCAHFMEVI